MNINFRTQVVYRQRVYVDTYIEKIGNSSITLNHNIYADEKLAADANSVIVHFDYSTNTPIRVPEDLREQVKPFFNL